MKRSPVLILLSLFFLHACQPVSEPEQSARWLKGNLHTHSFWSDGDDFPEMIMDWYKKNDYQFIALSDHNILQEGEKWIKVEESSQKERALEKYRERFGAEWVETSQDTGGLQVRLKNLSEYRSLFERPDSFLILRSEEISDGYEGKPIHLNATNVAELIEPQGGNSVAEVMQNNIDAVLAQRKKTGRPMFPHLNHPNFGWAVSVEDMKKLNNERFFEVYNGHPLVNNYGDASRPGMEVMWDMVNAFYIRNNKPLLYGIAVDDSHNYHEQGPRQSNSGRGWVMVKTDDLREETIIEAMEAGRFYASTGVELEDVQATAEQLIVWIKAKEGVQYTAQFWGARKDGEEGELLAEMQGAKAVYRFNGDELFVRAKVISNEKQPNPFQEGDLQKAWTQPVRPD